GGVRGFRRIRVYRSYASEVLGDFVELAKLSAEREFKALVVLKKEGARVPDGIAYNRHAVVQEYIPGVELYKLKPGLVEVDAEKLARTVVETIRIAYTRVGIVHGDLSEYNVLAVLESSEAYVIDWPQYVYRDEPSAESLLRRDASYIVRYFRSRWGLTLDQERVLRYVKGEIHEI
ncbi:MAG: RIO1 family regulatory kinase/ATPase, partial [Acidilobaceae archaeon]